MKPDGLVSTRKINRRHLLKSSGEYFLFLTFAEKMHISISCSTYYHQVVDIIHITLLSAKNRICP